MVSNELVSIVMEPLQLPPDGTWSYRIIDTKIRVANLLYLKPDVEILDFLMHLAFLKGKKR